MRERAKQILGYAVGREAADEVFYRHWGERSDVGDAKQLLKELADEELRHIEKLSSVSPGALGGLELPYPRSSATAFRLGHRKVRNSSTRGTRL